MIDPNTADDIRSNMNPNLQTAGRRVMSKISRWVEANNDFVPLFRRARIALEESRLPQLRLNAQLRLIPNPQGGRQYDLPVSTHEIGAFLPESNRLRYIDAEWSRESGRDICLYLHERPDSRIDADFPRISDLVHEVDYVFGIQHSLVREESVIKSLRRCGQGSYSIPGQILSISFIEVGLSSSSSWLTFTLW